MTDPTNGNGNGHESQSQEQEGAEAQATQPTIVIQFAGPDSAAFSFNTQHVTPAQLYALRGWLDFHCQTVYDQVQQFQQQQQKVARPSLIVPPGALSRKLGN